MRLDWENRTSELLLTPDLKLNELATLAAAIDKYAGKDALVLGWWDTSRQLKLLSKRDTLFSGQFSDYLVIPTPWQKQADAIRKYEDDFWAARQDGKRRRDSSALPMP